MSYILIQNDGEVESGAFELIGASTKRDSPEKIGFFGSGLKYSIAFMLRHNIDFKIYSGEKEIKFSVKKQSFREKEFERICINDQPTSYTTSMGPTWTEDWFILREIYCNALDETNCQLVKSTDNINPVSGKTRVYIELTDALNKVIVNWDNYFSNDREVLFNQKCYTSYVHGTVRIQNIKVFQKTDGVIFRKGIRSHEQDNLLFDYELEHADINEDRRLKHHNALGYIYCDLAVQFVSHAYVLSVLRTGTDTKPCHEYTSLIYTQSGIGASDKWVKFSEDFTLVVKEISGKYSEKIQKSEKEVLLLPSEFARKLKQSNQSIKILGMGKIVNSVSFSESEVSSKMTFLLKEVIDSLRQMKYTFHYDITIVSFSDMDILGQADTESKHIYLSDRLFDMGRREIALTIIEECEHIVSKKGDETRGFQTHLISSWLKTMEETNALFL